MEIFDSHLHLDSSADLDLSITNLIKNCNLAGVAGGLIICMQNDPWEFEAVAEKIVFQNSFKFAINPDLNMPKKHIAATVKTGKMAGAVALKIHPRLQRMNLEAKKVDYLVHLAEELDLPVIICSFNDGSWGRFGLTNNQFLRLADNFPSVKFLWAHAGGHNVLDFMFMARRTSNVFLDSSFTQSYFFKGSVPEDLNYASESLPTRFMFGTDFEGVAYPEAVKSQVDYYLRQNKNRELFFGKNYKNFLGIDE